MIQTVKLLFEKGKSLREISRLLNMSRNTVREIIKGPAEKGLKEPVAEKALDEVNLITLISTLLGPCRDNLVRVQEVLSSEYQQNIPYSTLTRLVRMSPLREGESKRFGEYVFEPGDEMQHDTSPHDVMIDNKMVKTQCASLILGFSRMHFIQYYPRFTRFEAKVFLNDALVFFKGSARRCVIDNTSVILASGAGSYAVIASEMLYLCRMFGFEFIAHAVMDSNRKGKVERPFYYVETNFLAGRTFQSWDDLNQQARLWCETVANKKVKRVLEMAPETAYIQEKPYLLQLPSVLPKIYEVAQRLVDTQGYIHLDTNRYSIPEALVGKSMDVYQYIDKLEIYYKNNLVAEHVRMSGCRNKRVLIKGHHLQLQRRARLLESCEAERLITNIHPTLDSYIQYLKSHVRGRGMAVFRRLLHLKQSYPMDAFIAAVEKAHRYKLSDMSRLENMILKQVTNHFFNL